VSEINVTSRQGAPQDTDADTRVVGLFEGESLEEPALQALVDTGEAKSALKKVALLHDDGKRVLIAGLGKRDELDAEKARIAAAVVAGRARELGSSSLSWAAPSGEGVAGAIVEGTLLALYRYDRFKSSGDDGDGSEAGGLASLEISSPDIDNSDAVEQARVRAEAQNAARDLQNAPSNLLRPTDLAERAREVADAHDTLTFESLDRAAIEERGMGAFAAVAQGSDAEPRLIVLRYEPPQANGPHLGYVGKAVTFDTGGISIKPAAKMHEMKFDMSGGAAVIEAMGAIATLGTPVRITAVVPSTENMPSGHAMKPGDIVTAMNGKTIEINNTDAEGRLILADALAYAVEQGAERIIDLATLTGAIIVALGSTYAGLFSNDDDWFTQVEAACSSTGELGWRLPLHPEFFELTKGTVADLVNSAEVRKASSIYAAEFLRQFVDGRPWVHVDIAGTAWNQNRPYVGSGATGFGVRMLVELAERAAAGGAG
jgi:leucyl aminopeptidase